MGFGLQAAGFWKRLQALGGQPAAKSGQFIIYHLQLTISIPCPYKLINLLKSMAYNMP